MARKSILRQPNLDTGVFEDRIANQLTTSVSPSFGDVIAIFLADGGTDEGFKDQLQVPAGTMTNIVATGYLDGAPAAANTLAIGFRKRAIADNEAGDGAMDAEQTSGAVIIGSDDLGYSDEDKIEIKIPITAADYTENDSVPYYFFIDASGTSYVGNFALTELELEYTP